MQKVKDIFSDYSKKQDKINEAEFLRANLYKKSNRLEETSKPDIKLEVNP